MSDPIIQNIFVVLAYAVGFALVGFIVYLARRYFMPWIQARIGADNFNTMLEFVRNFMAAAEEMFPGPEKGEKKAAWVIEQVTEQLEKLNIHVEKEVIKAAIDGSMAALEQSGIVNRK